MNAYELADDEKNISNAIEALEWVQKATPLLRQQADEIKCLHQILGYEGIEVGKEYLDECVAELRKTNK